MGQEGDGKREEGGVPENFLSCRPNPRKRPLTMSSSLYTAQSLDLHYTQYCVLARPEQSFRLWGNRWHYKWQYNMSFEPLGYPAHCFLLPIMPPTLGLLAKQTAGKWILPALTIHFTRCYSQSPAWAPPSLASCYPPTRLWRPLEDILQLSRVHPKAKNLYF